MNLSMYNLAEIVNDLKEVTKYDINFISTEGIILYSTNNSRIGTFHAIGKRVCMTGKIIEVEFNKIIPEGVKCGINSPIIINNNIVGCIGVTGNPEKVRDYQVIVKKLTERYIQAQLYVQDMANARNLNKKIINAIVSGNSLKLFHSDLISKDLIEDVDMQCIIIHDMSDDIINDILRKYQTVSLCAVLDDIFLVICSKLNVSIVKKITDKYQCQLIIGPSVKEYNKLSYSYNQAYILFSIKNVLPSCVNCNDVSSMYIIANEYKYNRQYYHELFLDKLESYFNQKELKKIIEIFITYIDLNKSVSNSSEKLHLTESTIKYQLNKLYNTLDIQPEYTNLFLIYIACQIYIIENKLEG